MLRLRHDVLIMVLSIEQYMGLPMHLVLILGIDALAVAVVLGIGVLLDLPLLDPLSLPIVLNL